jgi:hypothetical protein
MDISAFIFIIFSPFLIMKINFEMIQKIFNRKLEIKNKKDKITLSHYSEYIPMYDIFSDEIYPINSSKLYYRLIDCHYRFITDEVRQWIENKLHKTEEEDMKTKYDNILSIIDNYDLDILEKTSYETLYRYSPDFGLTISICKRNSFHPYATHLTPYYTKNELIKLGMNNMLINKLSSSSLIDKKLHYDICKKVSKNDISYETILVHMRNIIDNNCIGWIVFYSMTGSYIFNKILRSIQLDSKSISRSNSQLRLKTKLPNYMYLGLKKIIDTINKVDLPKDYYFYRFVWDDEFLRNLKIGEIFVDNGLISTTRDPFYSPGLKMDFGLVLIKINVPEHLKGVGLLVENFSMFPKEEEFLIQPFTKLKLKAKNDKATYYHINEKFEKIIKKRYEFDMVSTRNSEMIGRIEDDLVSPDKNIPIIDIFELNINSNDRIGLFSIFLDKCDSLGQFRYIYNNNNDNIDIIFICQWFDSTGSYSNMYKNKTKDGFIITHYINGYPTLSIEMGEDLYVNYFRTICPYDNDVSELELELDNNMIEDIVAHFARLFKYNNAKIFFTYKNFTEFDKSYLDNKEFLYTRLYCDTIYRYFKTGENNAIKYYKYDYGYYMLDKIGKTKVDEVIINKLPKEMKRTYTWKELYIDIVEKYFYLYKRLEDWMNVEFNNVSHKAFHTFNIVLYLKSKGYDIADIPNYKHSSISDRGEIFRTVFNENIRRV